MCGFLLGAIGSNSSFRFILEALLDLGLGFVLIGLMVSGCCTFSWSWGVLGGVAGTSCSGVRKVEVVVVVVVGCGVVWVATEVV